MAIRNIVGCEEFLIRKKSRPVTDFDENLWTLLDDMKETMDKNSGCGIAAVQVGVLKRVCIVDIAGMFFEFVNPEITKKSGSQTSEEGCLSVKGKSGLVERPYKITVNAFNRYGFPFSITVEEQMAIVCCHEIDHLDGILYTDKAKEMFDVVDKKD